MIVLSDEFIELCDEFGRVLFNFFVIAMCGVKKVLDMKTDVFDIANKGVNFSLLRFHTITSTQFNY